MKLEDLNPRSRKQAEAQLGKKKKRAKKTTVAPSLKDRMNKTEAEYACILDVRVIAREVSYWSFESLTFRLADRTTYTPDFFIILPDNKGFELHEIKGGFIREDSFVKFKIAADRFPWFIWRLMQKTKEGWHEKWHSSYMEQKS